LSINLFEVSSAIYINEVKIGYFCDKKERAFLMQLLLAQSNYCVSTGSWRKAVCLLKINMGLRAPSASLRVRAALNKWAAAVKEEEKCEGVCERII
jgi:hypothetical protein